MNLTKEQAIAKIMSLQASSFDDVQFLAEMVDNLDEQYHPAFAAGVIHLSVMIPQERFVRFMMWVAEKRGKTKYQFMQALFNRLPGLATALVESTAEHILLGVDSIDEDSVGGFSQEEMQIVCGLLLVMSGAVDPAKISEGRS